LTLEYVQTAIHAPADAIPVQSTDPSVVVSLTEGCDAPLEALKLTPDDHEISCHPCDEAIVRLLLARSRRGEELQISSAVAPGTLSLG
jgi:hypothetical protein